MSIEQIKTEFQSHPKTFWTMAYAISLVICLSLNNSMEIKLQKRFGNNPCFQQKSQNSWDKIKPIKRIFENGKEILYFKNFEVAVNILSRVGTIYVYDDQKVDAMSIIGALYQFQNKVDLNYLQIQKKQL